jgi:hypothetical protein
MVIIKSLKLALQNAQYTLWRWSRPDAAFKDYFASIVLKDIATGRKHPTLGGNLCEGRFGEAGEAAFHRLLQQGIAPDDICVDYGCGTLRIGVHAMRFLRPSGYWGLDINHALLDTGVHLIGSRLLEERKPNLRVISHASVKEAAQANPSFLFSIAVLIHIHPQELEKYFRNILLIVGKGGRGRSPEDGAWAIRFSFHGKVGRTRFLV